MIGPHRKQHARLVPEIRQRQTTQARPISVFGPNRAFPPGISLATNAGMSPTARVFHERFEEICRAELVRLRRKTASLSPSDRTELDVISLSVARAIAARLGEAVDRQDAGDAGNLITQLFAVRPDT
jgi:hypothetical protein